MIGLELKQAVRSYFIMLKADKGLAQSCTVLYNSPICTWLCLEKKAGLTELIATTVRGFLAVLTRTAPDTLVADSHCVHSAAQLQQHASGCSTLSAKACIRVCSQ